MLIWLVILAAVLIGAGAIIRSIRREAEQLKDDQSQAEALRRQLEEDFRSTSRKQVVVTTDLAGLGYGPYPPEGTNVVVYVPNGRYPKILARLRIEGDRAVAEEGLTEAWDLNEDGCHQIFKELAPSADAYLKLQQSTA